MPAGRLSILDYLYMHYSQKGDSVKSSSYIIAVCIKQGDAPSYRVDVETEDETGAKLLAQLLKEHDPEVELREVIKTRKTRILPVRPWPRKRKS